jgi:hypothetical protein
MSVPNASASAVALDMGAIEGQAISPSRRSAPERSDRDAGPLRLNHCTRRHAPRQRPAALVSPLLLARPPAHQSTRPRASASAAPRAASAALTPSCTANPSGRRHIAAPTRCSVVSGRPVGSWPMYDVSRVWLAMDCVGGRGGGAGRSGAAAPCAAGMPCRGLGRKTRREASGEGRGVGCLFGGPLLLCTLHPKRRGAAIIE